ncbi:MAG: hypothetical protein Q7R93_04360 [bacterium]|nr:hypothetical protein [bacterium]
MVIQLQTSFIPKKSPMIAPPTVGFGGHTINLFAVIGLIVFFLAAGLAATVFFYRAYLVQTIGDMDTSLAAAKKSFEPEFIDKASRLNFRIMGAKELLDTHRALSPLFDILEKKTLESVRFQDFNFSVIGGSEISLLMTGQAKSFNAVALQSDVFGTEPSFKDPIFSNFNLSENGDIIFNFRTTIDAKLLRYRETVLGATKSSDTTDMESSKATN